MKNLLKLFKKFHRNAPRRGSRLGSIFKSYGLKPARVRLDIDYFTIVYCQNRYEDISRYYLLYKYLHVICMIIFLCLNVTHADYFEKDNLRWHLYLNHWSTLVCFAEASCGVFVVSYFRHHCRTKAMRNEMNISDSANDRMLFYMYLNATAITFSTAASFLFWVFIFDKDYLTVVKVIEHGSMPAFMVLKLMIERVPFEIPFVFYPMLLLICYFVNVIITYYAVYQHSLSNSAKKQYIFKHFNTERPMFFFWFAMKACLILAAVHVLLVAIYVSKRVALRLLCQKHRRRNRSRGGPMGASVRSYTPAPRILTNWMSTTEQDIIASPISTSTNPVRRAFDIIGYLETLHRQDFIHPEWRHYSADYPSGFYLLYRLIHMLLFIIIVVFSMLEIDKFKEHKHSVKYIILWIFYFANFFLVVSMLQSILGFTVIFQAYRRDVTLLKYYQKSDSYVTGFQKGYSTIHSAATTLAIFAFATSWQLVEDTAGSFQVLDYTYDSAHIINPLAMILDFMVVGHPFKFVYVILSMGLLGLNFVFNYWLYSSKITSRNGKKFVYEYLNWDDTSRAASNMGLLFFQAICIHIILWIIFLFKRYYGIVLNRRRVLGYQVNASVARMSVTKPQDWLPTDYGGERSIPRVEFTHQEPEAGPSQNEAVDQSDEQDAEETSARSSGGSFQPIGTPSTGTGSPRRQTIPLDTYQPPVNADLRVAESSIKSLIEKIKALSFVKSIGSSASMHAEAEHPSDPRAPLPVQDLAQTTDTKLTMSPTGSKRSSLQALQLSTTSIPNQESPNITTPIPVEQRSHSPDTQSKAGESILSVESTKRKSSVGSRKSSHKTSFSSKTTLPVVADSNTENKEGVNDSAEAKAEPISEKETPHTGGKGVIDQNESSSTKASPPENADNKETGNDSAEAKAEPLSDKEPPHTNGSGVSGRNKSSTMKLSPPEKKSDITTDDRGHERENPESKNPIVEPSVKSFKSKPLEHKDNDRPSGSSSINDKQ